MAEKIHIDIFRKKDLEQFSETMAKPDAKVDTGSAAALVAAQAAALLCRAAAATAAGDEKPDERMDYILRNAEILRRYMVHLVDEDVKSRAPLKKAMREGKEQEAQAARQPACAINAEIINMMGKVLELGAELSARCPDEAVHYLAESAELAMGACRCCAVYVNDMSSYCTDETYRFVRRRENEMLLEQFAPMACDIVARAEEAMSRRTK